MPNAKAGGGAPKKAAPGYGNQVLTNLANLPPQAYNSFQNFGAAGGLTAILGPMMGGNPIEMFGLKLLQSRFNQEPKMFVQATLPVSIVEVKDTAFDRERTISSSASAYTDMFSRRPLVAGLLRFRRGA